MQINKYNIRENRNQVDNDYKVRDKDMLNNHAAFRYGTPYKGPFVTKRSLTNGTVKLQYDAKKIRYNIRRIEPNKYDTHVEYINPEICMKFSTYDHQLYTSVLC